MAQLINTKGGFSLTYPWTPETPQWANAVESELVNAVVGLGQTADAPGGTNNNQLITGLKASVPFLTAANTFTGTNTFNGSTLVETLALGNNSFQAASTSFVQQALGLAALVDYPSATTFSWTAPQGCVAAPLWMEAHGPGGAGGTGSSGSNGPTAGGGGGAGAYAKILIFVNAGDVISGVVGAGQQSGSTSINATTINITRVGKALEPLVSIGGGAHGGNASGNATGGTSGSVGAGGIVSVLDTSGDMQIKTRVGVGGSNGIYISASQGLALGMGAYGTGATAVATGTSQAGNGGLYAGGGGTGGIGLNSGNTAGMPGGQGADGDLEIKLG